MEKMLTIGDLKKHFNHIKKTRGLTDKEFANIPIYIGDDDELNGIHSAFFVNTVDPDNNTDEDNEYYLSLIEERIGSVPIEGLSLLIS